MLLLGSSGTGSHGDIAKAVDFDGTNDYLSRASDLTGNADGKTFTFSAWVWVDGAGVTHHLLCSDTGSSDYRFQVNLSGNLFGIVAKNSANAFILSVDVPSPAAIQSYTLYNLLVSADLSNSSNRQAYVNDVSTTASWGIYTNDNIDFTTSAWKIAARYDAAQKLKGRLAHVFLDYTYRDLSNVTNRRLFITSDRKPAQGQAALNPILYLPMDDPSTAHINQGTGGNFTLNGVIARSGRGPNQFNAAASTLNGTNQYLSRGAIGGSSKLFTVSFLMKDATSGWVIGSGTADAETIYLYGSVISLQLNLRNSALTSVLDLTIPTAAFGTNRSAGRWSHVIISIDLANTSNRQVVIDGVLVTGSCNWNTYTNANYDLGSTTRLLIGTRYDLTNNISGKLSSIWLNQSYIDLSQPTNLAKFVTGTGIDAKPADLGANGELPFGTSPLIYLPMYGNNAGKNYGTGGDFTVNSGPYPGARGPNEFWGNKADFDGSTGYLARTSALSGVSDGKTFSCSFWVTFDTSGNFLGILNLFGSGQLYVDITRNSTNKIRCVIYDVGYGNILDVVTTTGYGATSLNFMINVDLSNTSSRSVYIDNVAASVTWTTYLNQVIRLSAATTPEIGRNSALEKLDGKLSEFYFTTDYIDFSQEANRLLFRDAFGNPTDLPALIAKGDVPNPAIYMRFDPANQGLNSGTGGDFTKSGTITDGGQL